MPPAGGAWARHSPQGACRPHASLLSKASPQGASGVIAGGGAWVEALPPRRSAMFAVSLVFVGITTYITLRDTPLYASWMLAGFSAVAAFPDDPGVTSWFHCFALAVPCSGIVAYAAFGSPSARLGVGRAAVMRAHVAASVAWAVLSVAIVWSTFSQNEPCRTIGFMSENISLMHSAAALV